MRFPERSVCVFVVLLLLGDAAAAQSRTNQLLQHSGTVVLRRASMSETNPPSPRGLQQRDLVRTLEQSTALIALEDLTQFRMRELSVIEIPPARATDNRLLNLLRGTFYFFSREKPKAAWLQTPHVTGATRGTEFLVLVEEERTTFVMYDGQVLLEGQVGEPMLVNRGEAAIAEPGQPLRKARIETLNIVQWWLFYPAVIDLNELELSPEEQGALKASLDAYRAGDLLAALAQYPQGRVPASDAERVYYAGLQLGIGEVGKAEELLSGVAAGYPLANALRTLIAAVKPRPAGDCSSPQTASELLAHSYLEQAEHRLKAALMLARQATEKSGKFSFAWHRVAELEFGFGRTRAAKAALQRSLSLAPRNAQARALLGYVIAAENRIPEAIEQFNLALAIDYHLGNAWLGRGLCRIRSGLDVFGFASESRDLAMQDLQTAVIMEPNRSVLRSYLGKAFGEARDYDRASLELDLARSLDTNDPTAFLYSALLKNEQNQINTAIEDLEHSQELNDNRAVYRSQFLLDQDRSVRSASLAPIYQRAGMEAVSVREAARAVSYDYANYSAHLFLANSYDALRDPTRFNLRYETVWFNELLLANMLAPVGAGALSQNISQQEYSRLFEANRIGLISDSRWRSDDQFRQLASQYGTFGNTSYSLDLDYQHNAGVRPNNELDRIEWYSTIKQQITPHDALLLLTKYQDFDSGDNFQYYDPNQASRHFRVQETQEPLLMLGYHREWSPNVHSLLAGGRLINDQRQQDREINPLILTTNLAGRVTEVNQFIFDPFGNEVGGMDVELQSEFEIYYAELNQLFQYQRHLDVIGIRYQTGEFETQDRLFNPQPPAFSGFFANPPASGSLEEDFDRLSVYGYHTWEVVERLWLTGGFAYDRMTVPENFRHPPISSGTERKEKFSPKGAVVWSPLDELSVRGAYTRSLGGVSFDESFRLEPSQLAGFAQSFRTLSSESISGSVSAPEYETAGLALDVRLSSGTYLGLQGERLRSEVERTIGVFNFGGTFLPGSILPASTSQSVDYTEHSVAATVNQLFLEQWSLGARYRYSRSEIDMIFDDVPSTVLPRETEHAELHETSLFLLFSHPSGFFARAESHWYIQHSSDFPTQQLPSEDFFQHNAFVGYRFPRKRAELVFGILNFTDQDYRLNPLTPYAELPRERVYAVRLRIAL